MREIDPAEGSDPLCFALVNPFAFSGGCLAAGLPEAFEKPDLSSVSGNVFLRRFQTERKTF